jgi:hypothetical protein
LRKASRTMGLAGQARAIHSANRQAVLLQHSKPPGITITDGD